MVIEEALGKHRFFLERHITNVMHPNRNHNPSAVITIPSKYLFTNKLLLNMLIKSMKLKILFCSEDVGNCLYISEIFCILELTEKKTTILLLLRPELFVKIRENIIFKS